MLNTNVELSKKELELVTSSEFILTKNRIIEKVYNLFGSLSEVYKGKLNIYTQFLPAEVFAYSPKIYKGENYLGLPYVMMDHPRVFLKEDVFAIRSLFWWGNYFSITLHLSGRFLQAFKNNIEVDLENGNDRDYFICVNDAQWEHHFEETNYQPLGEIDSIKKILHQPFFKLAKKLPLVQWDKTSAFYADNYTDLIGMLTRQY